MLKSYEVTIEGDRIKWLDQKPKVKTTHALIIIEEETIAEETTTLKGKRTTPAHLIGKAKILGDI